MRYDTQAKVLTKSFFGGLIMAGNKCLGYAVSQIHKAYALICQILGTKTAKAILAQQGLEELLDTAESLEAEGA